MTKKLILLACLVTSYLVANENRQFSNCPSQIGRYQITANDKDLYLLETDTGRIWVAQRFEAKDIRVMYLNGWKELKINLPNNNN